MVQNIHLLIYFLPLRADRKLHSCHPPHTHTHNFQGANEDRKTLLDEGSKAEVQAKHFTVIIPVQVHRNPVR